MGRLRRSATIRARHTREIRLEWGPRAVEAFEGWADVVVVVDVLSFSSAVDVAVSRSAAVVPSPVEPSTIERLRERHSAHVAVPRSETSATQPYSLSPASLESLPAHSTIVLPSPNGSALTDRLVGVGRASGHPVIVAGCLRNAAAVGEFAARAGSSVGVLAAGERWPDGSLRPAFEDLVGAGAVIVGIASAGSGLLSPEASAAAAAFADAHGEIEERISRCVSGQELIGRSYGIDVDWSAALDVSEAVPVLVEGRYVDTSGSTPRPGSV